MKTLLASLALVALTACGGTLAANLAAFTTAIEQGQAALVPAENVACEAATLLDPTGATADCTIIDGTGAAVGATFVVLEDAAAVAALVQATAVKTTPVVSAVLKADIVRRVTAKGLGAVVVKTPGK